MQPGTESLQASARIQRVVCKAMNEAISFRLARPRTREAGPGAGVSRCRLLPITRFHAAEDDGQIHALEGVNQVATVDSVEWFEFAQSVADPLAGPPDAARQRAAALARWENEGGAPDLSSPRVDEPIAVPLRLPALTPAEWDQLRLRVIAIENLLITILAEASDRQRELARAMSAYISPRPGFTPHPLTLGAASQMVHLIERAGVFQGLRAATHD
jgi:hypothetical protein